MSFDVAPAGSTPATSPSAAATMQTLRLLRRAASVRAHRIRRGARAGGGALIHARRDRALVLHRARGARAPRCRASTRRASRPWSWTRAWPRSAGMAASRRHDDLLWVHNDSHAGSRPFALGHLRPHPCRGRRRGSDNTDWEDLAGFTLEGEPDDADRRYRRQRRLARRAGVVVPEPELVAGAAVASVRPRWVLRFRWPDGPRDREAVVVDVPGARCCCSSKKRVPAQLFRLPLWGLSAGPATVAVAATDRLYPGHPSHGRRTRARSGVLALSRTGSTAMDVAPSTRRSGAARTYGDADVYRGNRTRHGARRWRAHLWPLGLRRSPQAEAIAFDRAGRHHRLLRPAPAGAADPRRSVPRGDPGPAAWRSRSRGQRPGTDPPRGRPRWPRLYRVRDLVRPVDVSTRVRSPAMSGARPNALCI